MKPLTYHLDTDLIKANCLKEIALLPIGANKLVVIKDKRKVRSEAQHRLRWVWFEQLERELAGQGKGRSKDQWNLFFKHRFVPHILIQQDEDYVSVFQIYKETCNALTGKHLKKYQEQFWGKVISTKDMDVKHMRQWLDAVDKFSSEKLNVLLNTPEDLRWVRD